ncbi:MAG: fluoride efflux transporter CrcB [Chthoniobacterales bacterium]
MVWSYLAVMAGGALGVGARMFMTNWLTEYSGESFPWGTFAVNVIGCFIIGVFAGLTGPEGLLVTSPLVRQVVMVGVLGGFTTFSSFSLQTLSLISNGQWLYASGNIALTVFSCLIATTVGLMLASLLQPR